MAPGDTARGSTAVRHWLRHVAVVLAGLAVVGFLTVVSGIVPIKASAGHWPITRWFLSFAMARSVATHSLPVSPPPLDDPALVLKGAGHYDLGCRSCHGSPGQPPPVIARAMTPHPPHLPRVVAEWEPEELFYIVKHGVKFTAMPAWPTMNRDDEVWAMVAFLRALPGLDAAAYARLVGGEDGLGDTGGVVARCSRCHGEDGNGRGLGAFPKLAGQRPDYLLASIEAFARGERHSGIMMPVAAALDADDVREVVRHYADLPRSASPPARADDARVDEARVDDALRAIGEGIAQRGIPAQRVPACAACHGPGDTPRNPIYPELANQYAGYLALQLRLFKDDRRGGTPYAHIMAMVASRLTADQMRAVAAYYASLPPARRTGRDRR